MRRVSLLFLAVVAGVAVVEPVRAQTFAIEDPVLRRIWQLGMEESRIYDLAQALLDSIGPRLTGTPQKQAAHDWAVKMFGTWGIAARNEQYGTWTGWRRGTSHIDLLAPRVRSLEGTLLGWSGGTRGRPVEGPVVVLPDVPNAEAFEAWLPNARGRFVAVSFAEPTCRPDRQWQEFAARGSFERMDSTRRIARAAWNDRRFRAGPSQRDLHEKLERAGALGVVESNWSNDYGVNKVFRAYTRNIPAVDLSCEDYGLVFRLAERGQGPRLRVTAEAEWLGEVPTYNTIAEIRGSERPDEYVMLSAHFDSWDSASGATDNGTGSVLMMEAMRILRQVYPNPKRTILLGLWGGEEQGLNGSRAFAHDRPDVVSGLHALFNQDNGTGRVVNISMQGLTDAGAYFARWLTAVPQEISSQIELGLPGMPSGGGTDHASFVCAGAPAFSLGALSWGYGTYTWHTNRDTFDKLVFDDLRNNATLVAMLAYLASEEPERMGRARRVMPTNPRTGEPMDWPECRDGARRAPD
jgi:carboxypeptidase Q